MPSGKRTLGPRPSSFVRSPQSTRPGSPSGAPVPEAAQAFMDGYAGEVEIKDGGHIDTVRPKTMDKFLSSVRTLEGNVV